MIWRTIRLVLRGKLNTAMEQNQNQNQPKQHKKIGLESKYFCVKRGLSAEPHVFELDTDKEKISDGMRDHGALKLMDN